MHPAPPSIDINKQTIARLAVERLFWRMKNGLSSPSVVVTVSPTLGGDNGADDHQPALAASGSNGSDGNGRAIHHSIGPAAGTDGDGEAHGGAVHAL